MTALLATNTPLTATDRCDRCGAQAYVRVVLSGGGDLMFCAHHGRQYEDKLRAIAQEFHDETAKLSTTKSAAPADER